MKRIFILCLLVLLVFSVGCQNNEDNYNPTDEKIILEVEVIEDNITDSDSDEKPYGRALFIEVVHSYQDKYIKLEGLIYDSITKSPIQNLPIIVLCEGRDISNNKEETDSKGFFYLTTDTTCQPGNKVWAEVEYNGKIFESEYIIIPRKQSVTLGGSSSSSRGSSSSKPKGDDPEDTCTNGIQDDNEQGIDCGGDCANECTDDPIEPEDNCTNGIQDDNEQGIDCGGDCANECTDNPEDPQDTCTNDIYDDDEAGIDCGGNCPDECEDYPEDVPEFTTIGAALVLFLASFYILKKRS